MPFVASGSYGCVFRPHLKCVGNHKVLRGTIGKVFEDEDEFQIEQEAQAIIRTIDPEETFALTARGSCNTDPAKYRPTDNVSKCTLIDASSVRPQIIYKNGGKSLDGLFINHSITTPTFIKYFKMMAPIFKGLTLFQQNCIIHQDIKPDNIVYDGSHLYLIDFGIMSHVDKHYRVPTNKNMLSADYPYFPPEYKVIKYMSSKRSLEYIISRYLDNFVFSIQVAGKVINLPVLMQSHLQFDIDQEVRSMYRQIRKMKRHDRIQLASKIDVYQLGICIFLLWLSIKGNQKKNMTNVLTLLRNMIHPNVFRRYDAHDAWREYQAVLAELGS